MAGAAPTDGNITPYCLAIDLGKDKGHRFPLSASNTVGREKTDILLDREDTIISRSHGENVQQPWQPRARRLDGPTETVPVLVDF